MDAIIGGGAASRGRPGNLDQETARPPSFMADVIDASMTRRSSSISGRPGAARASSSARRWKRRCARPRAPCAWSRSTSTRIKSWRRRCASSRSRRSMPSRTAGRSTASSARCPKARSSNSSTSSPRPAARRRLADRRSGRPRQGSARRRRSAARRQYLRPVIERDPDNVDAHGRLAKLRDRRARIWHEAGEILAKVPAEHANHADIVAARSRLELAEAGAKAAGAIGELEARLARDPKDHQARLDLAIGALCRRPARAGDR